MRKPTDRQIEANRAALDAFRSRARKTAPTRRHRAALWENMLGTVYAMNAAGVIRYFDYDYADALAFAGVAAATDVRVSRFVRFRSPFGATGDVVAMPRDGQRVWFVRDPAPATV